MRHMVFLYDYLAESDPVDFYVGSMEEVYSSIKSYPHVIYFFADPGAEADLSDFKTPLPDEPTKIGSVVEVAGHVYLRTCDSIEDYDRGDLVWMKRSQWFHDFQFYNWQSLLVRGDVNVLHSY